MLIYNNVEKISATSHVYMLLCYFVSQNFDKIVNSKKLEV